MGLPARFCFSLSGVKIFEWVRHDVQLGIRIGILRFLKTYPLKGAVDDAMADCTIVPRKILILK